MKKILEKLMIDGFLTKDITHHYSSIPEMREKLGVVIENKVIRPVSHLGAILIIYDLLTNDDKKRVDMILRGLNLYFVLEGGRSCLPKEIVDLGSSNFIQLGAFVQFIIDDQNVFSSAFSLVTLHSLTSFFKGTGIQYYLKEEEIEKIEENKEVYKKDLMRYPLSATELERAQLLGINFDNYTLIPPK